MKIQQGEQHRGFLLSCQQNREKQAIKDAFNFLNEFIQKLYPDLQETGPQKRQFPAQSLEDEVKQLKKKENRVLFSLDTDVKCLIFIKINPLFLQIDPVKVVQAIMDEMKGERVVTRYCHKILPVQKAFRAQFLHMKNVLKTLFTTMTHKAKGEKKSWALHFKCRNNDKFKYKEIVQEVGKIGSEFGHFAEIYYPEWTVAIEICNHLMCVSIVERFKQNNQFKLKKLNVTPLEKSKQQVIEQQKKQKIQQKQEQKQVSKTQQKKQQKKQQEQKQTQKQETKEDKKVQLEKIQIGEDDIQFI